MNQQENISSYPNAVLKPLILHASLLSLHSGLRQASGQISALSGSFGDASLHRVESLLQVRPLRLGNTVYTIYRNARSCHTCGSQIAHRSPCWISPAGLTTAQLTQRSSRKALVPYYSRYSARVCCVRCSPEMTTTQRYTF